MANTVGLYEGGTTGLRDGTLISSNDTETNPYTFAALNATYTLHYRVVDSNGNDPSQDSTTNIAFTCPTGVVACFTVGGTYVASPTVNGTVVTGGNKPIYLKQTSVASTAFQNLTIGALEWETGSRCAQVGTVTPTAGDASVALDWADVTAADYYEVQRATDSGFTANLITLTTTITFSTYTNNAANGNAPVNDTTYYYRVRASDERGIGPWSATASATPAAATTSDFASTSQEWAFFENDGTWATAWGDTNADVMSNNTENPDVILQAETGYEITRGVLYFNLAALSGKTVTAGELHITAGANSSLAAGVYQHTGTGSAAQTWFNRTLFGSSSFGASSGSFTAAGEKTITLTAAAISYLNTVVGSTAKIGLREVDHDVGNVASDHTPGNNRLTIYGPGHATTAYRPHLRLTYT